MKLLQSSNSFQLASMSIYQSVMALFECAQFGREISHCRLKWKQHKVRTKHAFISWANAAKKTRKLRGQHHCAFKMSCSPVGCKRRSCECLGRMQAKRIDVQGWRKVIKCVDKYNLDLTHIVWNMNSPHLTTIKNGDRSAPKISKDKACICR